MADPAGEADRGALRLDFDRRLMLRFHGSAITSDGGFVAAHFDQAESHAQQLRYPENVG
jgi:hypothetical protein